MTRCFAGRMPPIPPQRMIGETGTLGTLCVSWYMPVCEGVLNRSDGRRIQRERYFRAAESWGFYPARLTGATRVEAARCTRRDWKEAT